MKELKSKLGELSKLIGSSDETERIKFNAMLEDLKANHTSDEERQYIADWYSKKIASTHNEIKEIALKVQLEEVSKIVSLSYIAEHYFNRTRNWLYQRINGNIVGGKPMQFNDEELKKLQFAINDIGRQLESFTISKINY